MRTLTGFRDGSHHRAGAVAVSGVAMAVHRPLDVVREHPAEYRLARKPALLTVGAGRYLAVEGRGPPGGAAFQAAIGSLYGVAFTLKFALKKVGRDFKVAPLEALWWGGDPGRPLVDEPHATWHWKLLIRVPDHVGPRELAQAQASLAEKGRPAGSVRLERLREGRCVQMLHVGPYDSERPALEAMVRAARAEGCRVSGPHHEIYFSDPRRVPPARLRTLLRFPVAPARA
jgi:hypothetical protein